MPSPIKFRKEQKQVLLWVQKTLRAVCGTNWSRRGVEAGRPGVEAVVKEARPVSGNL